MLKRKKISALVLLLVLILTGCQPTPQEVLDENAAFKEAQKNDTSLKIEKDSIENIFKTTPDRVDIDLGTIRLNGVARVPDVKEIPVLTLERNKMYYDNFETFAKALTSGVQIDPQKITDDGIVKSFSFGEKSSVSVGCHSYIGISDGDKFNNAPEYKIVDRILPYLGEKAAPERTIKMDGKDVKLQSVIDNINTYLAQDALNLRPDYKYELRTVDTRLLEDGVNYGIEFEAESSYKGIPFDSRVLFANEEDCKANHGMTRKGEMFNVFALDNELKKINNLWGTESYNVVKETASDNNFLTLEAAFERLKDVLSKDTVFEFRSAELVYSIHYDGFYELTDDEEKNVKQFTATPAWFFALVPRNAGQDIWDDIADPHGTFIVDAVTGDVSVNYAYVSASRY